MQPIGFSTGAIALSDVARAVRLLNDKPVSAIELSAIRVNELEPLLGMVDGLDLGQYSYVSLHAPSRFSPEQEAHTFQLLYDQVGRGWPIIVHPDTLYDLSLWRLLGDLLCVENMDERKPVGRTVRELDAIFSELPGSSFCFDIGHARQVDPSMTQAYLMLKHFGGRLRQLHISEVNTSSKHDPLSYVSILDFQEIAGLLPGDVPVIIESTVSAEQIVPEIDRVRRALGRKDHIVPV